MHDRLAELGGFDNVDSFKEIHGVKSLRIDSIADDVIRVPHVPEFIQPIVTVIPLQLLSYHIALLRGCDVLSSLEAPDLRESVVIARLF